LPQDFCKNLVAKNPLYIVARFLVKLFYKKVVVELFYKKVVVELFYKKGYWCSYYSAGLNN
jgi:hypothetical protein